MSEPYLDVIFSLRCTTLLNLPLSRIYLWMPQLYFFGDPLMDGLPAELQTARRASKTAEAFELPRTAEVT